MLLGSLGMTALTLESADCNLDTAYREILTFIIECFNPCRVEGEKKGGGERQRERDSTLITVNKRKKEEIEKGWFVSFGTENN